VLAAEAELLGDLVGVAVLGVADEHAEALGGGWVSQVQGRVKEDGGLPAGTPSPSR
jgi:hypothetical protein